MMYLFKRSVLFSITLALSFISFSQFRPRNVNWTADGNGFTDFKGGNIVKRDLVTSSEVILVKKEQLIPQGKTSPLEFAIYNFSADYSKLLIYTNTARVWRYNTRGDYWVLDIASDKLVQLGKGLPPQSLMFAKLSPDHKKAAYVSEHNIFVEDLATHQVTQLTKDGSRKFI